MSCAHMLQKNGVCPCGWRAPAPTPPPFDHARWTEFCDGWSRIAVAVVAVSKKARAAQCRRRLSWFVRDSYEALNPGQHLTWTWYLEAMCDHVQWVLEGWRRAKRTGIKAKYRDLLINVPPGAAKTFVVSVCAPAWMWIDSPEWSVLCLSVNPQVARDAAVLSRMLINSEWYVESFVLGVSEEQAAAAVIDEVDPDNVAFDAYEAMPAEALSAWEMSPDRDTQSKFVNTCGGFRASQGMAAQIIGLRADCVAGETSVATEHGDMTIKQLHEMEDPPRVWSQAPGGGLELRRIVASRAVQNRPVIRVRTESNEVLTCTRDHKIFTEGYYTQAAHVAGRQVSVLRRAKWSVPIREASPVREVCGHDVRLSGVLSVDEETVGGRPEEVDVYDIQVDGNHNFFANGILVHNCIFLDDPNDPKASTERNMELLAHFGSVVWNRVKDLDCAVRIVIQQRLDPDDLSGYCERTYKRLDNTPLFVVLRLPLLHDVTRHCSTPLPVDADGVYCAPLDYNKKARTWTDPRTVAGETLSEIRYPREQVLNFQGQPKFSALYQQDVSKFEGEHFAPDRWGYWRRSDEVAVDPNSRPEGRGRLPAESVPVQRPELGGGMAIQSVWVTMDATMGSERETASHVGLLACAQWGKKILVLHDEDAGPQSLPGQLAALDRTIRAAVTITGHRHIKLLIEEKALGLSIAKAIRTHVQDTGYFVGDERVAVDVETCDPGKDDKTDRGFAMEPTQATGMILLPQSAPWLEPFIREFRRFPRKPNDKVDALGQLVTKLLPRPGSSWRGFVGAAQRVFGN